MHTRCMYLYMYMHVLTHVIWDQSNQYLAPCTSRCANTTYLPPLFSSYSSPRVYFYPAVPHFATHKFSTTENCVHMRYMYMYVIALFLL